MSYKFNEQWTHRERIELLLNVLQGHHQDLVPFLARIIQESRLAPQWNTIALPEGTFPCPESEHTLELLQALT